MQETATATLLFSIGKKISVAQIYLILEKKVPSKGDPMSFEL